MTSKKFCIFELKKTQIYFKPYVFNSRDKMLSKKVLNNFHALTLNSVRRLLKVSVNENFSTLLDFVFFLFLAGVGPKFYFGRKRKSESVL